MPSYRIANEWLLERWILVAYLIINWRLEHLREYLEVRPSREFYAVTAKYLNAYVNHDEMPPDDVAPAILNMADDFLAGRDLNMRAGDYIAIQNHLRR